MEWSQRLRNTRDWMTDRMTVHSRGRITSLVSGLALAAAACGGGDGTGPTPPPPGSGTAIDLNLALGESVTLTDPAQVGSFGLDGASAGRQYQLIVQSATTTFGASNDMRLKVVAGGASANVTTSLPSHPVPSFRSSSRQLERRQRGLALEDRLRRNTRRELARVGAQPVLAGASRGGGARFNVVGVPPTVGQNVTFKLAVQPDLSVDCNSAKTIDATIKWVGTSFAIAQDVQNTDEFSPADLDALGQLLDGTTFPLETAYFGSPADLDGNQRVIALITAEVNRMTPRSANFLVAGFFFDGDLFDPANCPASNQGELFYLIAPDPGGVFSDPISTSGALSLVRTTVGHEFLHLLNSEQRLTIGGGGAQADEDTWLDEGLAHLAEELNGLAEAGLGVRRNLDLDGLVPPGDAVAAAAFNDFHILNLQRAARFALDPEGTLALGDASGGDPGGTESLKMRGFGYLFVRWLGDQFGPAGSGVLPGSMEQMLFRELSSGGPSFLAGTENVERAVQVVSGQTRTWDELLADFLSMLAVDDNGVAGIDPAKSSLTWNYPGLFGQLSQENFVDPQGNPAPPPAELQNPYPLIPEFVAINTTTNMARTLTVNASTGAFFILDSTSATPDLVLQVTTGTGLPLPTGAAAQVTITRTR